MSILEARIVGRELIVEVMLDRSTGESYYEGIGGIHGAVAELDPDVDRVTIEDFTGQRISVAVRTLSAFYNDQIGWDEYRNTWQVVNP